MFFLGSFLASVFLHASFSAAAPSANSQDALFGCLRNKGYGLETSSNANYGNDRAAYNRRLSYKPVAIVFP